MESVGECKVQGYWCLHSLLLPWFRWWLLSIHGRLWSFVCHCGHLSLSMHGQLWLFVCQRGCSLSSVAGCGGVLIVVPVWAAVVVQVSM